MKNFVTLALLGLAQAQDLDNCSRTSQCDTDVHGEGACCSRMTFKSFSDDPVWGDFVGILSIDSDEDDIQVGNYREFCINEDFKDLTEKEMKSQGYLTNVDDLRNYMKAYPDVATKFGGEDPELWITAFNSDMDTHYKFILERTCVEDLPLHLRSGA